MQLFVRVVCRDGFIVSLSFLSFRLPYRWSVEGCQHLVILMAEFPVTNGITTVIKTPEGYLVDFEHPQQQKVLEHYLVFGILGPLAFLTLIQRFYTKFCLSDGPKIDDCE